MLNVLLWIVVGLQIFATISVLVKSSRPGSLRGGYLAAATIIQVFMVIVTAIAAIVV